MTKYKIHSKKLRIAIDGSPVVWTGRVRHFVPTEVGLSAVEVEAVITRDQFHWDMADKDGPVLSFCFADVVRLHQDGEIWNFVTQPFDFPIDLMKVNPTGSVDNWFFFDHQEEAQLMIGCVQYSRAAVTSKSGFGMLDALNGLPVSDWRICPLCGGRILRSIEHAASCSLCNRIFTDPGFEPVVSLEQDDYGALQATTVWFPLGESDYSANGRTLVWYLTPSTTITLLPRLLRDYEAISNAFNTSVDRNQYLEVYKMISMNQDERATYNQANR